MIKRSIFIASCSFDREVVKPVVDILMSRGYDCVVFESDLVVSGKVPYTLAITAKDGPIFTYADRSYRPDDIVAAWNRRPSMLGLEIADKGKQMSLSYEMRNLNAGLFRLIDPEKWLNAPSVMSAVDNKLLHLSLAKEIGFTIPDTVVSNSWHAVQNNLPEDIIMKLPRGLLYVNNEVRSTSTTALKNTPRGLPIQSSPFPGIYQPKMPKIREWRITVVGDHTFDASIYSQLDTYMLDWRAHQYTPALRFKSEAFPPGLQQRCKEFLRRLGLRYGAFDFIENEHGITFLECNVNGQYLWLEELLGLPITAAIADELTSIASHSHAANA